MEQKKLSITVFNADGDVLLSKDPAIPQMVNAILSVFDEIGNTITINVSRYVPDDPNVLHSGNA